MEACSRRRRTLGLAFFFGIGSLSSGARAEPSTEVFLLPTVTPTGDGAAPVGLHRPLVSEVHLFERAGQLDALLTDAVQDLDLKLDLSGREAHSSEVPRDEELLTRAIATSHWVISPRLELDGGDLRIRIVAAPPTSKVLLVRSETLHAADLPVKAVAMLRDLVSSPASQAQRPSPGSDSASAPAAADPPGRSQGRAVLATNATVFGGFVGYALQRSSGSSNVRLLFPLMALGTGFGLGASLLVSEEWDIQVGHAWYLSAGAWWPAFAGMSIAEGAHKGEADRFTYGLGGAGAGVALASIGLSLGRINEGGALAAHSLGSYGTFVGGMTQLALAGSTTEGVPYRGAGYGALAGIVAGGLLATQWQPSASRVLLLDLGVGLGGLGGAAVATPFLLGERTSAKQRAFLVTTMGATLAGGAVAWISTRNEDTPGHASLIPQVGLLGESEGPRGEKAPIFGGGVFGIWR